LHCMLSRNKETRLPPLAPGKLLLIEYLA
jgi:hypothetical protein